MTSLAAVVFFFSILRTTSAVDFILVNQPVKDGHTISSAGGTFELGFFSPGRSKNRYLGIWHKNVPGITAVWVANRETPITDSSGVLKITDRGILVVVNGTNATVWSSNSSRSAQDPNAQLLDTGNLVVKNGNDSREESYLWQSFDYPGNTLLPNMKLGWNLVTGLNRYLSSWKSDDDPSTGNFTYGLDLSGFPQRLIRTGLSGPITFRDGPWNGVRFVGIPHLTQNSIYKFSFVSTEEELYFIYYLADSSVFMRLELTPDGYARRFKWTDGENGWSIYSTAQRDECDDYEACGANGICDIDQSPKCQCLKGFKPKIQSNWNKADWSSGCVRIDPLDCQKGYGFVKYPGVKIPDTSNSWFNKKMSLDECSSLCLRNCSCTGYANTDITGGGSGCLLWFHNLIDIRNFSQNGEDFYVKMPASESDIFPGKKFSSDKKRKLILVISISVTGIVLFSLVLALVVRVKRRQKSNRSMEHDSGGETNEACEQLGLHLFELDALLNATNNFSADNKLGEGGFGPVYKGILPEGQEIAVKIMSKASKQGLKEFENEVESIAKLQHRNLVKLLGCCINGRERMLIYEYLPNKSLDLFIFGQVQGVVIDWPERFTIINGIARGLLYLHQDSRHRIIHRDLKAENILLDREMNPKISDFGIARSFGGNDNEANTKIVAGTLGYMSPEYASEGFYSTKSDVFSFGVIVLEIISGKRNRGFQHPDHSFNLLGHAWTLFMEDRPLEFIDPSMGNTYDVSEVLCSMNLGLLCVQRFPDDRPSMHSVVLMLSGKGTPPQPKEPCFFTDKSNTETTSSSLGTRSLITNLEAR